MMPKMGDKKRAMVTFISPEGLMASMPELTMTAPTKPPMSACDELDGMPNHQVTMFQITADIMAAMMTGMVTLAGSVKPVPMVSATATPNKKGPAKWATAARYRILRGDMAREAMGVATMLELSWKPFRKSKSRDVINSRIKAVLIMVSPFFQVRNESIA